MAVKTFIQKCKDKQIDELTHSRFKRFSVGEFDREPVLLKIMSKGAQVQTGFEYAPDLILLAIEMLGEDQEFEGEATLTAAKADPKDQIEAAKFTIKANRGKKYTLSFKLNGSDLKSAIQTLGAKFALLFPKFKCDDSVKLKMKASPPKPGSLKEKFCTLKVTKEHIQKLLDAFLFDTTERSFKKGTINHVFNINDVNIPKEYENDFAMARLHAKKVGTIKRVITLDEKEVLSEEINFEA